MLSSLKQNITYGIRSLLKNPGFSATIILTIALGIAASTAIFSVLYANLFEPLPLFGSFALVALVLAAIGVYGTMAFGVAQRMREFGIRMALGAQRVRVLRLVLKEAVVLAITGSIIGLFGAYAVGKLMQSTLYGVAAFDAVAFAVVVFVLLLAALLASFLPAWRASRVEPVRALRYE